MAQADEMMRTYLQDHHAGSTGGLELAFIPLANAEITPLAGGEPERRDFIAVGRVHVQLAYPIGERGETAPSG